MLDTWPVQDAKARFSEVLDACETKGPQLVTRRGVETAVIVTVAEWRRLNASARPSLKSLLLSPTEYDLNIPVRGKAKCRKPLALGKRLPNTYCQSTCFDD